ncbi:amidohydrolase family protein [Plantactinospora solaniradicis]|uniref:Amidohydrolase family protein n=1 Tax=Plantactinospora solaniradicis TaxID=1723736 RepID=A0ABW1K297_9ACTN
MSVDDVRRLAQLPVTRKQLFSLAAMAGLGGVALQSAAPASAAADRSIVIRGGYLITMDSSLGNITRGDVLFIGSTITGVGPNLSVPVGTEVIDASGMIVMPGLIDNHRHLWESLVRGRSVNSTFGQYFADVPLGVSTRLTPDDVYYGTLLGAYEAIDSGITTVLDWAHGTNTRAHALAGIRALSDSGIRAVYAYGPPASATAPDSPPSNDDILAAKALTDNEPMIGLAIGTRNPETATAQVWQRIQQDIRLAQQLGVPVTLHAGLQPVSTYAPRMLDSVGLLNGNVTFVHGNLFTSADLQLIRSRGAQLTASPLVEMQMVGPDILPASVAAGIRPAVSADIVAANTGDLFDNLRASVASHRMLAQQAALKAGTPLSTLPPPGLRDVLSYVTTNPAAALGITWQIGSLSPGKQADLIVIDSTDLNLFLTDPRDAVVHAAHPGNIAWVFVAGEARKRAGELVADLTALRANAKAARDRLG